MNEEKEVYMRLPAGIPYSIIAEAAERFNLKIVEMEVNVPPIDNGVHWRPKTLVLRGKREDLERARAFIVRKLEERVKELEERSGHHFSSGSS
ncbi:MAG: hypothetical protein N3F04_02635 [Candidatus Nezhaarchaeota archaeon]|nr:hypothetical protein [Candidatus Nezhaarchaeota archaeon]MCX8141667.1 hypothetical protein [Candidatus Nezhaarchaeota archaeon]MDW8049934.1 hypothetical protein [Nitrososphaerota archaeon]